MMNMVKTSAKTLVMAFLFGAAAAVRAGDIISIDVLEDFPYSTLNGGKHYPNPNNPHLIGETVSIRIRLVNDDLGGRSKAYPWEFVSLSSGESSWLTAPRLGLSVGGVVRYATMVSCLPVRATSNKAEKYFTDLIFEYEVLPGDLAQPLKLLNSDMREAVEGDSYLIILPSANSHFYNAVDVSDPSDTQRDAEFSFCSDSVRSEVISHYPPADSSADESGTPSPDYTLASAGVYIKTIDFDSDYVDTSTSGTEADPYIWRIIHQGSSTPTKNGNPSIVVDAAAIFEGSGYATMWVWTENDDKLTPVGATQTFNVDGVDRKALPVTISTGDRQKSFVIKATGAADDGAWVYMSSAPTNMYGTAGELEKNTVMRYIKIGEPMRPSVSVTFGGNSWTEATATDAYMDADYPVEMAITLSEPFSEDVTVTLTPVLKNGPSGSETNIDVYANHVIATAPAAGLGNGWQLATNSVTFTRNADVEKFLYVYPLGATTGSTRNGGTGIEFQISVEPATASAHFVTKTPGVLYVNPADPNVVNPVANQVYTFTAGKTKDIAITVDDSCRNMRYLSGADEVVAEGTNLYSVVWERNDDTSTSTMEWKCLVPDADGNLTLKDVKYPNSGTYLSSQITVTSPDGKKAVIPVTAEVSVPRTVTGTPDRADLTYAEGDTVKLTINLSKRDGEDLYAFVEPLNEAATNCISGTQVIGADGKEPGVGVSVPGTGTVGFKTLDITLLDGYCEPKFQVVLCSEEVYDASKVVDRYTPVPITIICENAAPQGKPGKSMRVGGYAVTNNASLPAPIPADNLISLRIDIADVAADRRLPVTANEKLVNWVANNGSDPDEFTNGLFIVKWAFYNPNGLLVDTRITVGSTKAGYATTNYVFTSIGDNEVAVQMLDKDMIKALIDSGVERSDIVSWEGGVPYGDENGYWESKLAEDDWGPEYRVIVPVTDKANVSIVPVNATVNADGTYGFNEGQTSGSFDIVLSTPAERPLTVKLWLERTARTEGATLDLPTLGSFMLKDTELAMDTNKFVTVDFKRGVDSMNVRITGMDGTPYSQYALHALVTTTTKNDNGVPLNEFYTEGAYDFGVFNYPDPKLNSIMANVGISYNQSTGLASTNVVTLTQNQEVTIEWKVSDNIRMDETNNFTVTWNSTEPGSMMTTNNAVRGTYKTKFSTAGEKTITLSINDKDGGANSYEWHFNVEASKRLYVYPHGPNPDGLSEQVATSYMLANGLGVGTVEADGALGDIVKFVQTWDYSVQANTAHVYARGLRAGEVDTNTIVLAERRGFPTQVGTLAASAAEAYWNNWSTNYDSFVYAFIQNTAGDGTVFTPTLKIKPQAGFGAMEDGVVMPLAEKDAIAYPDRYVEVIFSREWLEADNCGDINADGVPDVFALKYWAGGQLLALANGGAAGTGIAIGSDLVDLAGTNPDEDALPGIYRDASNSYAPIGNPFTTLLEIRGFGDGLNATDLTASDISLSEPEERAWKKYAADNGLDEVADMNLGTWSPEPKSAKYPRMDPTNPDTDEDQFPDGWEYYFWYMAKVWLPAHQQQGKDGDIGVPRQGQHFVFERFNPHNIILGIEISADKVMERFDPCTPYDPEKYTGPKHLKFDFDHDGLSDLEELLIGTNPCHWDTDGDRLCDSWEVMMCLNPLAGSKADNPDHDFMAYHTVRADMCWIDPNAAITDPLALGVRIYGLPGLVLGVDYDIDPDTGDYVMIRTMDVQAYSFTPKFKNGERLLYGLLDDLPNDIIPADWIWGFYMVDDVISEKITMHAGDVLLSNLDYILIHDQVHDGFGFDPRTGWSNIDGYVSNRWNPEKNPENVNIFDVTGASINTRPYDAYDEYLVMQYRTDFGIDYSPMTNADGAVDPNEENIWGLLRNKTTNPNVVYPETTEENEAAEGGDAEGGETPAATNQTTTASIAQQFANAATAAGRPPVTTHGADTDQDGVPDGWELYMYRNPNAGPTHDDEDGLLGLPDALDFDGDEVTWVDEYAGVDACEVYKDCASIYNHHPGRAKGWWNKFFPTNPGTMKLNTAGGTSIFAGFGNADGADTDLDGITDSVEGGVWITVFSNGGVQYPGAELGFIYGTNEDDGKTVCFRGGGMNPCTIDTDLDGIPDGWEMQHAGVPVQLPGKTVIEPRDGDVEGIELDDATFIADGIFVGGENLTGVYIAGGMDATWKGDAAFDDIDNPDVCLSYDELLGTRRDVDFDHDGLQNYQEYLTQSIRHFRYDDITTPLMGRQLEEGQYDPITSLIVVPHTQSFGDAAGAHDGTGTGYPVFDPADPETFVANAAEAWNGRNFVEYVTITTGVRVVVKHDPITGAPTSTNRIYYTAQKKVSKAGATLARSHAANAGTALQYAWTQDGWRDAGYFAPPRRDWDRAIASGEITVPLYMWPITGSMVGINSSVAGYATTDPRFADTDGDGLDDFYEMFHGLNPLLGTTPATAANTEWITGKSGDIISAQFWMTGYPLVDSRPTFNAWYNEWIYPRYSGLLGRAGGFPGDEVGGPIQAPQAYDPILYPWGMGTPMVDADGDGIRNDEERIIANVADPVGRHTDPTPLWFTERTTPASYIAQYYVLSEGLGYMPWYPAPNDVFEDSATKTQTDATRDLYIGSSYTYSFEENEGFDTDGDMTPDSTEVVTKVKPSSDPLRFDDPSRRQAFYLPGANAYAISRDLQYRPQDAEDFLKQFTVECWVMPEKSGVAQTIVERTVAYEGDSIGTASLAIRANFRIGLDAQGKVYGMFDNNDTIESGLNAPTSCQFVDGGLIPVGKWTHVALTFDGKALAIYVNGLQRRRSTTDLIPANGVIQIMQNPGNEGTFTAYQYTCAPSAFLIGARPKKQNIYALYPYYIEGGVHMESFDNLQEYFQGYVDEVRVWDGARTGDQILANYRKSMGFDESSDNRNDVYDIYAQAGTRNNNDGQLNLPAELVLNYDFSTLPGAVNEADVAKVPTGFYDKVLNAAMSDYATNPDIDTTGLYPNLMELKGQPGGMVEGDLLIGWWNDSLVHSTVYDDYHVIPWIKNTVSHLPLMDGSVADSFIYSDFFGSVYTPASAQGLAKFTFPNTAVPYPSVVRNYDGYYRLACAARRAEQLGNIYSNALVECQFQIRNNFIGTADLVPMGGAFAKTCPSMWDGSVADPWEQTGTDTNGDSLPDWWEEYARHNYAPDLDPAAPLTWETLIDYNGTKINAGLAYVIDLYSGMQPDGTVDPAYAVMTDVDGDNIPDWWENLFGIASQGADDDADNDGLSNYAEYMISFGPYPYGITNGWAFVSPIDAYSASADQKVTDYFLRTPKAFDDNGRHIYANEYFGEIFSDHDMMESWWELQFSNSYASPAIYDADKDTDGDGWDNFSENRGATWYGTLLSDLITKYLSDEVSLKNYPQPAIGIRFTYPEGNVQDISGKSVVVRTMTAGRARTDATFTIVAPEASEVGAEAFTVGAFIDAETSVRGYLQPGNVVPTACLVYGVHLSKEGVYYWGISQETVTAFGDGSTAGKYIGDRALTRTGGTAVQCWYCMGSYANYLTDVRAYGRENVILDNPALDFEVIGKAVSRDDGRMGDIVISSIQTASQSVFGNINFITGEFTLNPASLAAAGLEPAGMLVKFEYTYSISTEWPQTLWFNNPSSGRVRQGLNTIEAWIDLNGDGAYTAGEPYGVVRNVNIGWHRTAETVIELKDTSTIIPHYLLSDGSSDRVVVNGPAGGVVAAGGTQEGEGEGGGEGGGLTAKIAVRRVGINGQRRIGFKTVPVRTLVSKTYVLDDRDYVTEADVISNDKFDLDWKWLVNDAEKLGVTVADLVSAEYEISSVQPLSDGSVTNIPLATFVNEFGKLRPVPVTRAPLASAPVYSAAPTFAWTCADETMTAFRLQVSTSTNASDVIYDSGITQLPGRIPLTVGVYGHSFTAPIYINDPIATNGAPVLIDGTNYFWRVTEYNAKFNTTDTKAWSSWTEFQMDVANANRYPKLPTGYGQCGAIVRYYGPNTNDLTGVVIVEAHKSADFTDQPLAQLRADVSQLDDMLDVETVNAMFAGIEPGEVFLMAYIDANNNGRRDTTESWGYANYVATDRHSIYSPRGITVTDEVNLDANLPKAVIYIEDVDVNRNEIPDCLETGAGAAAGSAEAAGDADRDGILDEDEDGYGTDASVWDTDGDGMPDGWEVKFADLDPNFEDALEVADGDVMAFVTNDCMIVTIQNTDGSDAVNYILADDGRLPVVGDSIDGYSFYEIYDYPLATADGLVNCYGRGAKITLTAAAGTTNRVVAVKPGMVALVHAQVYDEFGFNPKTAVDAEDAVNTKPFTALDKYLVIRYLAALGICDEDDVNVNNKWSQYSLKPLDADNDRDGAPDGWELYVMFGKNEMNLDNFTNGTAISCWNFDDRFGDGDGDGLELSREFDGAAPTDPWNAHTISSAFTDYDAWLYNLKTHEAQLSDADNDGLSNIQEYRAHNDWGLDLDVAKMRTDDETIDYFRAVDVGGVQHYIGELVADHDFMEDYLEDEHGYDRGLYDATKDSDKDGWSNWAELRSYVESGVEYVADIVSNRVIRTNISVEEYDTIRNNYEVIEDTINFNARYDDAGNLIGSTVTGSIIYFDTQAVMRVQSLYSGTPYPTVHLTVAYNGEKDIDAGGIVVEAYSSAKMQKKLCWWNLTAADFSSKFAHNGYITLELKVPDHGYLKEGTTHFAVFADMNSDGVYSGAEPFGIAKDVKVGYDRTTDFTVELKDITPVVPRIDFANFTCDRVTLEGMTTNTSNVAWGDAFAIDGEEVRVRVIRTAINGDESAKKRTLLNRVFTVANRSYLHEGDFMTSLKNDLDPYLAIDAKAIGIASASISEATYEVVLGDAKYKAGSTNENEGVVATFVNSYPKTRTTGTPIAPSANSRGTLTTAQATFDFKADTSAYTAYVLEVSDSGTFATILHSTTNLLTGAVKGTVSATPAWYFEDGKTYYWRVALMNGKYVTLDKLSAEDVVWSETAEFTVDLRGRATAGVNYFGPAETDGKIVVEAYLSPDFVGDPIARVEGGSLIDGTNALAVAGLPSGEVYLLAFIDRNGDGVRQSYESWGYACKVGTTYADLWTPVPVTINAEVLGDPVVAAIYIEDTDINQNFIVDPLDDEEDLKAAEETIENENSDADSGNDQSDRDGDGLKGYEEEEIGTDPDNRDTDGDGMWDGWEVWAGTDPLSPEDATYAADGDVMAYDEINRTIIKTRSTMTGLEAFYIMPEDAATPTVGDNMNGKILNLAYEYGRPDLFGIGMLSEVPTSAEYLLATVENTDDGTTGNFLFPADAQIDVGTNVTDFAAYEIAGMVDGLYLLGMSTNLVVDTTIIDPTPSNVVTAVSIVDVSLGENRVIEVNPAAKVALIHNQVYKEYGFNSKTAVSVDDAINTKPFTALDKYLLIRYFEAQGLCDEKSVNANCEWALWSLKPDVIDGDWGDDVGRYGDGIADGWELYVDKDPWDFDDRESDDDGDGLPLYREFDVGNVPTNPWYHDTDDDGVFDSYAYYYHLKGDQAGEDPDEDGLSNYAEYLISEVFQIIKLDPNNPMTHDSTLDYYQKFGELYLGEMFTDHDRIADAWEALYEFGNTDGIDYAARGIYDPNADLDHDGWSNYAEYRAGTSPAKQMDAGIDDYILIEHPVPVVEMEVVYNGSADIEGRTLTVSAWNEALDPDALAAPVAKWTVTTVNESDTAALQNATTGEELKEKYIGRMPKGKKTYYLGFGAVKEGSFKLCVKDKSYVEGDIITMYGQNYFQPTDLGDPDTALWFFDVIDDHGKLVTLGGIFAEAHQVGTIDYNSGRITIDFDDEEFTRELYVGDPEKSADSATNTDNNNGNNNGNNGNGKYHGLNPPNSHVKFTWSPVFSVPVRGVHFLGDTAEGFLREGLTTFVVDAAATASSEENGGNNAGNNNGGTEGGQTSTTFNNAHIYGVVRHVDVGWAGAKFKVELTDFNPITSRIDLGNGTFDRAEPLVVTDPRINVVSNVINTVTAPDALIRVRVVRYAINGYPIVETWGRGLADVVYDKTGEWDRLFCELDFLLDDKFDIDWTSSFTAKVANTSGVTRGADGTAGNISQVIGTGTSVTNMQYMVVIGDGDVAMERPDSTNTTINALGYLITRRFDYSRAKPVAVAVDGVQYSARPTFKWRMDGEEALVKRFGSSYTAFRLRVNKGSNVVYDSGILRAPAVGADGNFTWTAPICAGSILENGQSFDTAASYSWQVSMYNTKFRSDSWSESSVFSTAANAQQEVNDHGYSSIAVAVKYAGPSVVLGKCADLTTAQGKVIVQAFTTPDFSGDPLAQCLATTDVAELALAEANAWLKGLPAIGTYFIRAFIDMDGDGKLSEWEPWGYVADEVTLVNDGTLVKAPLVSVWIEDSDSDRDWVPDAYEYAAKGWTTLWETLKGNKKSQPGGVTSVLADGGIVLTLPSLDELTGAGISTGLPGASLTAMQSPNFVAAVMGITTGTYQTTLEAIAEATRGKLVPKSVRVVAFSLAQDGSTVNLTVGADVASGIAGSIVEQYYQFAGSDTVKVNVKVLKKNALSDTEWTEVYTTAEPVSITADMHETIPVQIDDQDLKSGFFKLELKEVP